MRHVISKNDFRIALSLLVDAFEDVPGTTWVIQKKNKKKGLTELCRFCLMESMAIKGAYLSECKRGVALIFPHEKRRLTLSGLFQRIKLIQRTIGWFNLLKVAKHQRFLKSKRRKNGLYFWMLAANNRNTIQSPVIDLKNAIFSMADEQHLPVYLETTLKKNMLVYRRFGFEVYHEVYHHDKGFRTWFMSREPLSEIAAAHVA